MRPDDCCIHHRGVVPTEWKRTTSTLADRPFLVDAFTSDPSCQTKGKAASAVATTTLGASSPSRRRSAGPTARQGSTSRFRVAATSIAAARRSPDLTGRHKLGPHAPGTPGTVGSLLIWWAHPVAAYERGRADTECARRRGTAPVIVPTSVHRAGATPVSDRSSGPCSHAGPRSILQSRRGSPSAGK